MFPYFSMWEINKLIDYVFLQKILKFYYMLNELTISSSKPQSLNITISTVQMSMAKATKKSQVYLRTKRLISARNRMFENTVWERFPCEEALIQEPMFETHASLPTTVRGIRGTRKRTIFCYPLIQRNTSSKHLL